MRVCSSLASCCPAVASSYALAVIIYILTKRLRDVDIVEGPHSAVLLAWVAAAAPMALLPCDLGRQELQMQTISGEVHHMLHVPRRTSARTTCGDRGVFWGGMCLRHTRLCRSQAPLNRNLGLAAASR